VCGKLWGPYSPDGLLGLGFKGGYLGGQFLNPLDKSVGEVDDSGGVAQAELGVLLAEPLDGGVGKSVLLVLDGLDFLFEVLETALDGVDVDFAHACVGLLLLVIPSVYWVEMRSGYYYVVLSKIYFQFLRASL